MKIAAFATTAASCITQDVNPCTSTSLTSQSGDLTENSDSSRRSFVRNCASIATSASVGWFANLNFHSAGCACSDCTGADVTGNGNGVEATGAPVEWFGNLHFHSTGCSCSDCTGAYVTGNIDGFKFGPSPANAYERDVGDSNRSADAFAQNLQARETNARLEASGFKLDTKEEEAKRLNDAFASFSYDDINSKKSGSTRNGYNKSSTTSTTASRPK